MSTIKSDFLIIGSGLAGLSMALKVSEMGTVNVLAKSEAPASNTSLAQGGIAAVSLKSDSFKKHVDDTLQAGAGLCHPEVVENVINQAPSRIKELLNYGVPFDESGGSHHLTMEGGHSERRIFHVEDHTGRDIHQNTLKLVESNDRIQIIPQQIAIDLILNKHLYGNSASAPEVRGAYVYNQETGEVDVYLAKVIVLATGGAGKAYLYTSNWSGSTGDGVAMAARAGARIGNMEFMQFHPTCLFHPEARNFLVSEAVRGEGGVLINARGDSFMEKYHPQGNLAPRDIVARSIDSEIKKSGSECVYLDISAIGAERFKSHFPEIHKKCIGFSIYPDKEPIPVVPAAHYLCGGVTIDIDGRTDIKGLFAVGETAFSGLHGANRLASNSLLECLAISHNASEYIKNNWPNYTLETMNPSPWISPVDNNEDERIVITHMWDEIRRLMWNYVGIVRSNRRLFRAQSRLNNITHELKEYYSNFQINRDLLELRNIALVADLTIKCATKRKDSVGIHFNIDCSRSEISKDSIIFPSAQ